jgi:hypothetical protein
MGALLVLACSISWGLVIPVDVLLIHGRVHGLLIVKALWIPVTGNTALW